MDREQISMTADKNSTADQPNVGPSPELFQQLGIITRQLHDTLRELGVMPGLQAAAEGLPDARSRLTYIAQKTSEAANKVLNLVDSAKDEQRSIDAATKTFEDAIASDSSSALTPDVIKSYAAHVKASTARIDRHLTEIMMAQDFHDLTGQVVAKVVALAGNLEDSLVKLLLQEAHQEHTKMTPDVLSGPVVNPEGRTDVVANQSEVDELLARMGF